MILRPLGEMAVELLTPWRRTERTSWGASSNEIASTLPGDDLVANPSWSYTHGITIEAEPADVWPWIVQMGQGRGGFYSFEHLENLVGCEVHNSDEIASELQHLSIGDEIRLHPKMPPLVVGLIDAPRVLALVGSDPDDAPTSLWAFHLTAGEHGSTRLIERGRYSVGPSLSQRLTFGPSILEPISFVMSRQMLRTIKQLVER